MVEGHIEKYKQEVEDMAIANKIAIINAMNKKKYKVFAERKIKEIGREEKQRQINELLSIFEGR